MGEAPASFTVETYTASDGYVLCYRHYPPVLPEGRLTPRARIVCVHGIQSHAGWYEHSCTRLSRAGFDVYFLDRRGSGMNERDRGDAPGFRRLLDDVAEFLSAVGHRPSAIGQMSRTSEPLSGRMPNADGRSPTFLLAISWGGKVAVALQRRYPGLVDGLALLCPGFCPRLGPSLRDRLRIVWARLRRPAQLFPVPLNDPELFTATPHWQQFIRDDRLGLRQATARLLVESVRLDGYLKLVPDHVRVPVLLLLAGRDRIIDNARTRRFVERFASTDKEVIEYPEAHHTLEFEPERDRIIDELVRWLERHSDQPRV